MRSARPVQGIPHEQHCLVIHHFPEDYIFEDPGFFTDPFRYVPHPLVRLAASEVISRIDSDPVLSSAFSEGKMLGVLVCRPTVMSNGQQPTVTSSGSQQPTVMSSGSRRAETSPCYIAAFSGNVNGCSTIDGFVPPIYDLTAPDGHFKRCEAEISSINAQIEQILGSEEISSLKKELTQAEKDRDEQMRQIKETMAAARRKREEMRLTCPGPTVLARLIKESQFEKAEARRLKAVWEGRIKDIRSGIETILHEADILKAKRAHMSDRLQGWIFRQYVVHNSLGEESSIADIFAGAGLVPPGGTGECAAPKLLEYAFRHGLTPLAMGEFWYGKSPGTAVRSHGRFYPSCTSKCRPLLNHMLKGKSLATDYASTSPDSHTDNVRNRREPVIVYEDEAVLLAEKPSGMPSVPGLDGRISLLETLSGPLSGMASPSVMSSERSESRHLYPVHRLDMDTSGIMVFAKTPEAAVNLRRQFEEHTVRKTYMARICATENSRGGTLRNFHTANADGRIDLPLSADYDERPRQKVDFQQGKPAHTKYRIVSENPDGTSDLLLFPVTGRTHQLRVHCAHHLGLGRPIAGDLLYGGHAVHPDGLPDRLHLHAYSITFRHPVTSGLMTFSSKSLCF